MPFIASSLSVYLCAWGMMRVRNVELLHNNRVFLESSNSIGVEMKPLSFEEPCVGAPGSQGFC